MNPKVMMIEQEQVRKDLPEIRTGYDVKVHYRVQEGNKSRIQIYQGIVIKIAHGLARQNFTVRKVSFGIGSERTFPYNSPNIAKIEVLRHGKVRRARLYYMRGLRGKAARVKEVGY
jgi:large subunit ribosomal protein L19